MCTNICQNELCEQCGINKPNKMTLYQKVFIIRSADSSRGKGPAGACAWLGCPTETFCDLRCGDFIAGPLCKREIWFEPMLGYAAWWGAPWGVTVPTLHRTTLCIADRNSGYFKYMKTLTQELSRLIFHTTTASSNISYNFGANAKRR